MLSFRIPLLLWALLITASCSGSDSVSPVYYREPSDESMRVKIGFVSYMIPQGWWVDPRTSSDLNRHLGAHDSAPEIAAAEVVVYLGFSTPDENELESATDFLLNEFQLQEDVVISDIRTVDIKGATEAYRVVYEQEFASPEFDRYHIADFAIRAPSGELAAVRVGAVTELVEDDTFEEIVDSLEVAE